MDSESPCHHCRQPIVFPYKMTGDVVACPHCNQQTKLGFKLFFTANAPPANAQPANAPPANAPSGQRGLEAVATAVKYILAAFAGLGIIAAGLDTAYDSLHRKRRDAQSSPESVLSAGEVSNSGWDGSVKQVKRWLEANANDPSSIQYMEWGPVHKREKERDYWVQCRFRAKNAFGALVVQKKEFYLDAAGNVTKVLDPE